MISLAIFLVIMLVSTWVLFPSGSAGEVRYREDPLEKQPQTLRSGEYYQYAYSANLSNSTVNFSFTYLIAQYPNCTAIVFQESTNRTPTCINAWGNDRTGSNLSLGNPLIHFFKPWMLAVHDGWQWKAVAYLPLPSGNEEIGSIHFQTLGRVPLDGRMAYKIQATVLGREYKETTLYWVDSENRVLLRELGNQYEIHLVSSPFS